MSTVKSNFLLAKYFFEVLPLSPFHVRHHGSVVNIAYRNAISSVDVVVVVVVVSNVMKFVV